MNLEKKIELFNPSYLMQIEKQKTQIKIILLRINLI